MLDDDTVTPEAEATAANAGAPDGGSPDGGTDPSNGDARSEDDVLGEIFDKMQEGGSRPRDAMGRFSAADGSKPDDGHTGDAGSKEPPPEDENAGKTQEAAVEQAQPAIQPPNSWPADMKTKWPSLPPEVQRHVAARESEAHQAISRMGQELTAARPFVEVVSQYQPVFEHHRMNPVDGIARLLNIQVQLDQDPVGTLTRIASHYGVDLSQSSEQQDAPQGQVDPQVAVLLREVDTLKRQLNDVQSTQSATEAQQRQAIVRSAADEVAKWSDGKEHYGNEQVRALMARFVHDGMSLDDAYDRATYAVPEVRAQILKAKEDAARNAALEADKRRTADARRTVAMTGRRAPPTATAMSEEDELRSIADRLYAR